MQDVVSFAPLITNDAVVFGCLAAMLALIFKTTTMPGQSQCYNNIPSLLLCYFLPSLLITAGIDSPK